MIGHIKGVLVRFAQLIIICVFEYGVPTTYSLALPVIKLQMVALTELCQCCHLHASPPICLVHPSSVGVTFLTCSTLLSVAFLPASLTALLLTLPACLITPYPLLPVCLVAPSDVGVIACLVTPSAGGVTCLPIIPLHCQRHLPTLSPPPLLDSSICASPPPFGCLPDSSPPLL